MSTPLPEPIDYTPIVDAATVVLSETGQAVRNPDGTWQTRTPLGGEPADSVNRLDNGLAALAGALNALIAAWQNGIGSDVFAWNETTSKWEKRPIYIGTVDPATRSTPPPDENYVWLQGGN